MRLNRIYALMAACALSVAAARASATELADCHIDSLRSHGAEVLTPVRPAMRLDGTRKSDSAQDYAKDAVVFNANVTLVRAGRAYVPSSDMTLHSSWPLNPDYRFQGGAPIKVTWVLKTPDGRKFDVITNRDHTSLFIDPDGAFCNHAMTLDQPIPLAGTLSLTPDGITLERRVEEREVGAAGLRIIYEGTTAGAMHFQEVWVKGTKVIVSKDRTFDQFATIVEIAGLKFDVKNARADSINVAYDLPEEVTITFPQLREIPIRSGPPQPGE